MQAVSKQEFFFFFVFSGVASRLFSPLNLKQGSQDRVCLSGPLFSYDLGDQNATPIAENK